MKVEVQLNHYDIKVLIDGLVHVCIDRKKYVGYHSYFENGSKLVIEYHYKGGFILTEFDTVTKWKQILKALNEKI
jgi:hypothetical protein